MVLNTKIIMQYYNERKLTKHFDLETYKMSQNLI